MTDLRELEKRLEEATRPDRGLDGIIARDVAGWIPHFDLEGDRIIKWHRYGGHWHEPGTHPKKGTCRARSDNYPGFQTDCPEFTKSLDAAVALVERVLPSNRDDGRVWLQLLDDAVTTALASDAKPEDMARLVCITLIRTLIAKGDRHD